jgi:hypothetical protein
MATVNVKIVYTGPIVDEVRKGEEIARYFYPNNSYVDTPVFTEGYENADAVGDKKSYGKSIYATNVDGWGSCPGLLPNASFTGKFAEFEQAVLAAKEAAKAGTENTGITFEIDGYEDELYWTQMARNMYTQGFYIEVGDKKFGPEPEADTDTDTDTQ